MKWKKRGFEAFSKGTFGNGGQNLYVSAAGVLQRIYHYDVNGDGYPDLLFANSQSMGERPPLYVYNSACKTDEYRELPSGGSYDAVLADLNGNGYDDIIIACQHNGTHTDITALIYFGSEEGLTEKYRMELPAPDATGVAAGDFNGDGKADIAFICGNFLRVFYQKEYGIVPSEYMDIPLEAVSLAAVDIDGDGACDLYVKRPDGTSGVLFGGPEGLSAQNAVWIGGAAMGKTTETSTSPSRKAAYRGWRCCIEKINGCSYLFYVDGEEIVFYRCTGKRDLQKAFSLHCPGAVGVSAGDLDRDGYDDIAVAVCTDKNRAEQSAVFWGGPDGFSDENCTRFDTRSAQSVLITSLKRGSKNILVVCQGGTSEIHDTESFILDFDRKREQKRIATLKSGDAMRILAGWTGGSREKQLIVVNHETGRVRGDENIYIYLGGPDGYRPERRLELPGWAAVDGLMYDFNDDGYVDVLICNCSENAPHLDPGSFLYTGGPDGLKKDRRIAIPSIRGHGVAIGDFRKSGYLDIAIGGFRNRELRIFRGGPEGYDLKNPQKIVLGPGPESYTPHITKREEDNAALFTSDELYDEYGEVRWLLAADFNNDGWLDLFVSQITGTYCYILWGGPEGFSTSRMTTLATGGVACANAADLDGDGYIDLVLGGHMAKGKKNTYESYITIYWGGPEGFEEHRKAQLPANCANSIAIGDFNGDGILDIFATSYNDGRCRDINSFVYYGEKGGIYRQANRYELFTHSGCGCIAGDFNGDGYCDLAVACHKGCGNHISESFVFRGGPEGLANERKTVLPTVGPHGMCAVDPGNIMDRSDHEYYYSELYRVPDGFTVKKACWEAVIPKSCRIFMQLRHAETEDMLAASEWRGLGEKQEIENGEDLSVLGLTGGYIQYRLALCARCGCGTPRVTAVTLEFEERAVSMDFNERPEPSQ